MRGINELMEWEFAEEIEVPQILHELTWNWTQPVSGSHYALED
jgi:hypothetical protein